MDQSWDAVDTTTEEMPRLMDVPLTLPALTEIEVILDDEQPIIEALGVENVEALTDEDEHLLTQALQEAEEAPAGDGTAPTPWPGWPHAPCPMPVAELLERIRGVLSAGPLHGEGHPAMSEHGCAFLGCAPRGTASCGSCASTACWRPRVSDTARTQKAATRSATRGRRMIIPAGIPMITEHARVAVMDMRAY